MPKMVGLSSGHPAHSEPWEVSGSAHPWHRKPEVDAHGSKAWNMILKICDSTKRLSPRQVAEFPLRAYASSWQRIEHPRKEKNGPNGRLAWSNWAKRLPVCQDEAGAAVADA